MGNALKLKEKDIIHEAGDYWVADEGSAFTVYKIGVTHSTSDSSYEHDPDGLSIAKARCDYLAKPKA